MSDGSNIAILLGNLGADPELRFTGGGEPVLNMRLATSKSWKPKDGGEKQQETQWHNVVMFGPRAEGLANILTKGSRIQVQGEIRYSEWEKDGQKKFRTDIVVFNVTLCGDSGGGERKATDEAPSVKSTAKKQAPRAAGRSAVAAPADPYGDDIPY